MELTPSALIFPETEPSVPAAAKLLLFFAALSYYLPTEADGPKDRNSGFFTDLCTGYAPAPLGHDLSRFNRLLREMETSRPDEFSRLFSAARTPGGSGLARDRDETSAGSVYSALHMDVGAKAAILNKERLWQARLILKLAELLNRREAEVRQGLAQISSVEQKLFAALGGLGEAETDDPAELSGPDKLLHPKAAEILAPESWPATSGLLIPLRLKAWAELYLADPSDPHPLILVTANPESGSSLLDGYENTWRRDPQKLFSLAIPAFHLTAAAESAEQYLASRNTFRRAARDTLEYFAGLLRETAASTRPATDNQEEAAILAENISAWEEKANIHFPGPGKESRKLDFYCFPAVSCAELLQRLFHLDGPAPAKNKQQHRTGILAVLKP